MKKQNQNTPESPPRDWWCHSVSAGKVKYWATSGNRGRITDVPRIVPAYSPEEQEAHAHLIVDCVNACEGINPEAVPELMEALRGVLGITKVTAPHGFMPDIARICQTAIAKAERKP